MYGKIESIEKETKTGVIKGEDGSLYRYSFDSFCFIFQEVELDMEVLFDILKEGDQTTAINIMKK